MKAAERYEPWTRAFAEQQRAVAQKTLLSDLRQVTLYFRKSTPSSYIVHKDEVAALVQASKRLHFEPGINPANGYKTAPIYQITVAELLFNGPYWWSTPSLKGNREPDGARIVQEGVEDTVFFDPAEEVDEDD